MIIEKKILYQSFLIPVISSRLKSMWSSAETVETDWTQAGLRVMTSTAYLLEIRALVSVILQNIVLAMQTGLLENDEKWQMLLK